MSVTTLVGTPDPDDGQPEISDADRISLDSTKIELGGKSYELHYGFGGLHKIEKHFGSVRNLLNKIQDPLGDGYFEGVFFGILFGLWRTGMTEEDLEELLDPADDELYGPPLLAAVITAFPREAQAEMKRRLAEAQAERAQTTSSPGPTSTTSRRSATGGRKKPSGK